MHSDIPLVQQTGDNDSSLARWQQNSQQSRKTHSHLHPYQAQLHGDVCSLLNGKGSSPASKSEAGKKEDGGTPEHGKEGSDEQETKKSEDRSNEEEEEEEGDSSGDEDEEDDQALVSLRSSASIHTAANNAIGFVISPPSEGFKGFEIWLILE